MNPNFDRMMIQNSPKTALQIKRSGKNKPKRGMIEFLSGYTFGDTRAQTIKTARTI